MRTGGTTAALVSKKAQTAELEMTSSGVNMSSESFDEKWRGRYCWSSSRRCEQPDNNACKGEQTAAIRTGQESQTQSWHGADQKCARRKQGTSSMQLETPFVCVNNRCANHAYRNVDLLYVHSEHHEGSCTNSDPLTWSTRKVTAAAS